MWLLFIKLVGVEAMCLNLPGAAGQVTHLSPGQEDTVVLVIYSTIVLGDQETWHKKGSRPPGLWVKLMTPGHNKDTRTSETTNFSRKFGHQGQ